MPSADRYGVARDVNGGAELTAKDQTDLMRKLVADGDKAAFAALFRHFAPRLKAYLMRSGSDAVTAEELMQDTMLSLWRRRDTFDASQASVSTWLFTIARNRRIDLYRRGSRPAPDPDDPTLVPAAEPQPDDVVDTAREAERIRAAVSELPEAQATLLRMAFYEDKAHSEIAEETGLPLGTVKSRLRLAIGKMRTSLGVEAL